MKEETLRRGRYYSTYRGSDGKYAESSAGDVAASHRLYDGDESKVQKLIKYELGKVGSDVDMYGVGADGQIIYDPSQLDQIDQSRMPMGSFLSNLPATLQESGLSGSSATGASIGAFFEKQGERRELKHTRLQTDGPTWSWSQNTDDFVQDFAENVGSYATASGKTSPVKRLSDLYRKYSAQAAEHAARPRDPDAPSLTPAQERSMEDFKRIAQALDTRMRSGGLGVSPEEGGPVTPGGTTGGPTGGAGRPNEAVQEYIRLVYPHGVPGGYDPTKAPTLTPV